MRYLILESICNSKENKTFGQKGLIVQFKRYRNIERPKEIADLYEVLLHF